MSDPVTAVARAMYPDLNWGQSPVSHEDAVACNAALDEAKKFVAGLRAFMDAEDAPDSEAPAQVTIEPPPAPEADQSPAPEQAPAPVEEAAQAPA